MKYADLKKKLSKNKPFFGNPSPALQAYLDFYHHCEAGFKNKDGLYSEISAEHKEALLRLQIDYDSDKNKALHFFNYRAADIVDLKCLKQRGELHSFVLRQLISAPTYDISIKNKIDLFKLLSDAGILTEANLTKLNNQLYVIYWNIENLISSYGKFFNYEELNKKPLTDSERALNQQLFEIGFNEYNNKYEGDIHNLIRKWPYSRAKLINMLSTQQNIKPLITALRSLLQHIPNNENFLTQALQNCDIIFAATHLLNNFPPEVAAPYLDELLKTSNPAEIRAALQNFNESRQFSEINIDAIFTHSKPKALGIAFTILEDKRILTREARKFVMQHTTPDKLAAAFVVLKRHHLFTKFHEKISTHPTPEPLARALVLLNSVTKINDAMFRHYYDLENPVNAAWNCPR